MANCMNCNAELVTAKAKKYCSNTCQQEYQYKNYVTEWLAGNKNGKKYIGEVSTHVRRYLHEQHDSKCSKCGWGEVNSTTGKVPLTVNHIDGNWDNHRPHNLELICPNCHSLTPNYGSLNRGKGRPNRN